MRRWLRRLLGLGVLGGLAWALKKYLDGDVIPASESGPGPAPELPVAPVRSTNSAPVATAPIASTPASEPATTAATEVETEMLVELESEPETEVQAEGPTVEAPADPSTPWVVAVTGEAGPESHPVKAKLNSGIYHLPGMLNYDRTVPDRWYTDSAAAEADGLRKAKR